MTYKIIYKKNHQRFINIEFTCQIGNENEIICQLPIWRPGRYITGNFMKNLRNFHVYNENSEPLPYSKIEKEKWLIKTQNSKAVKICYEYYADELNAGSSYIDENQLYINPVNCLIYIASKMNEKCDIIFDIPDNFKIACSLKQKTANTYEAQNFDELFDSPIITSNQLLRHSFETSLCQINVWFNGLQNPDFIRLENDFRKFIEAHFQIFKTCPVNEFHFLFQILPFKFFHGVEHQKNTVIALGPENSVFNDRYNDFLGVSCHEFFHLWNVKSIRPIEMLPYRFDKENFSASGYVYEGITTYYGDWILYQCNLFSKEKMAEIFSQTIQKHLDNFGRFHNSLADSSLETWVDGYETFAPNRKVSIYNEGFLIALIIDAELRKISLQKLTLDKAMKVFYERFGELKKGYDHLSILNICTEITGSDFTWIWYNLINKRVCYFEKVKESLPYIGFKCEQKSSENYFEKNLGLKTMEINGKITVIGIYPNSPSFQANISIFDIIENFEEINTLLSQNEAPNELLFQLNRNQFVRTVSVKHEINNYYQKAIVIEI